MKNIITRLGKRDVHLFIWAMAVLALNWPLLAIAQNRGLYAFYYYLFGAWSVLIGVIFLIALGIDRRPPADREENPDDV